MSNIKLLQMNYNKIQSGPVNGRHRQMSNCIHTKTSGSVICYCGDRYVKAKKTIKEPPSEKEIFAEHHELEKVLVKENKIHHKSVFYREIPGHENSRDDQINILEDSELESHRGIINNDSVAFIEAKKIMKSFDESKKEIVPKMDKNRFYHPYNVETQYEIDKIRTAYRIRKQEENKVPEVVSHKRFSKNVIVGSAEVGSPSTQYMKEESNASSKHSTVIQSSIYEKPDEESEPPSAKIGKLLSEINPAMDDDEHISPRQQVIAESMLKFKV